MFGRGPRREGAFRRQARSEAQRRKERRRDRSGRRCDPATATRTAQTRRITRTEYTHMIQLINRRNALRTGLLASGGLAALSQLGKAASPLATSKEETNKAIVGRWFTDFWGKTGNLGIVDAPA